MKTKIFKVTGMTCGGCVNSLTHTLKSMVGVGEVKVSLAAGEAFVQYNELLITPEHLKFAAGNAGFGLEESVVT